MTRGPRRLKDDPDFKWETGCDLADESLAVGHYDLPALRGRLLAQVPAAPPILVGDGVPAVRAASSAWGGWRLVVGVASAAAVFSGAYWLGAQSGQAPVIIGPAPVEIVAPPSASEGPAPAPPPAPAAAAPTPEASDVRPPTPREVRASPPAPAVVAPTPGPEVVVAPIAALRPVAAPTSAAQAQIDAFDLARDAYAREDFADAARRFEVLRKQPNGLFTAESALAQIHSLFALGDAQATLALLDEIEHQPALSGKRPELARLRAESLVKLNRCEEALLVAKETPFFTDLRRLCRQRKETPQ